MTCLCRNVLRNKVVMLFYFGKVFRKSEAFENYFDTINTRCHNNFLNMRMNFNFNNKC